MLQFTIKSASVWLLALAIAVAANQAYAKPAETGEEDESISISQLPVKVLQALRLAIKGEIESIEKETESGKTVFEIEVEIEGGTVERAYNSGDLVSQEESIGIERLPEFLHKLTNKFAGDSKLKLERKTLVIYELEIEVDGQEKELCVDASGRQVNLEFGDQAHKEEHGDANGNDDEVQKKHGEDKDKDKDEHDEDDETTENE